MNYHSDLLATHWLLWVNEDTENEDIRNKVRKGALDESTSDERAVFFKFAAFQTFRHMAMLLALVLLIWGIGWFVVPVAYQACFAFVIPVLMLYLIYSFLIWATVTYKKKASEAGGLTAFTGQERWRLFLCSLFFGIVASNLIPAAGFYLAQHWHL